MKKKNIFIIIGIVIFILICMIIAWYTINLKPKNSNNQENKIIVVEERTKTEQIVKILHDNNLIRSELATKIYIKLNGLKNLQAGKYQLNESMSLAEILNTLSTGDVYDESVKITFLEGKNMRWVAKKIAEQTNNTEEDVFNLLKDKEYIQSLISKYWFLTNTILDEKIYYPLEGYLYPDTYIFENKDVSVKTIFNIILNNTDKILTEFKAQGASSGRSIHEIMTMASIIEIEGNDTEARKGIASVLYNRLKKNMSLGSDVTAYYAMQIDMGERQLYASELKTYNPYNTRGPQMNGKLPIGPISNPSKECISIALNPPQTDYLYFVSDTNEKIYFTKTYEEHKKKIEELQKQGLWYEYN